MVDLIPRIEAANGPDRRLDAEIAALVRAHPHNAPNWVINWKGLWAPAPRINSGAVAVWNDGGELAVWWNAPRYTESVDAALTLVPTKGRDWRWLLDRRPYADDGRPDGYRAEVYYSPQVEPRDTESWCATAALAMCAAALKARAGDAP